MFLNYIKDFILKKTLKNSLINLENNFSSVAIIKVGLLIDSASFFEKEKLISDIVLSGILVEQVPKVAEALDIHKWVIATFWKRQEWACLTIRRSEY